MTSCSRAYTVTIKKKFITYNFNLNEIIFRQLVRSMYREHPRQNNGTYTRDDVTQGSIITMSKF